MRFYLATKTYTSKDGTRRRYWYGRLWLSGGETKTGKPHLAHLSFSPYLRRKIDEQAGADRLRRKAHTLTKRISGGRRGRPPLHMDREILAALGLYHRGDRLSESDAMSLDERARRRYALLDAESRSLLTLDEYIALNRQLHSRRKRANCLSLPWDAQAVWVELLAQRIADNQTKASTRDSPEGVRS